MLFIRNCSMMQNESTRNCLYCSRIIKGRSYKKFCDDSCRNSYHNQLHSEDQNLVRNINHALARNRRILQHLLPENVRLKVIAKDQLYQQGFRFEFHTQVHKNRKGNSYFFAMIMAIWK